MQITEKSLQLFLAYANDAGNWSGTPLVGGNIAQTPEDNGNLTQLKKAELLKTEDDGEGNIWIYFTEAGKTLALEHGVEI